MLKSKFKILAVTALFLMLTACTATAAQDTSDITFYGEDISGITADELLMFFEPNRMWIQQHENYSILQYATEVKGTVIPTDNPNVMDVEFAVSSDAPEPDYESISGVSVYFNDTISMDELWEIAVNHFLYEDENDVLMLGEIIETNSASYYSDNLETTVELYYRRYKSNASSNRVQFRYGNCVYCFSLSMFDEWDSNDAIANAKKLTENVVCP